MSFRKNAPDKRVHFLRLLRRRGASSAYGPDRFVSNDDTVEIRGCQPAQTTRKLLFHHVQGLPGVALVQSFAYACDDYQASRRSCLDFLADDLIRLEIKLASFRVAYDDV